MAALTLCVATAALVLSGHAGARAVTTSLFDSSSDPICESFVKCEAGMELYLATTLQIAFTAARLALCAHCAYSLLCCVKLSMEN